MVGIPDDVKGNSIYCYVTLMKGEEGTPQLKEELKKKAREVMGAVVSVDTFHWAPNLPKTRSGKIMRRILRKIAEKGPGVDRADFGDTSTLNDPGVVDELIFNYGK